VRALAFLLLALALRAEAAVTSLHVLDADSGRPIAGALVTLDGQVLTTDAEGRLSLPAPAARVAVRAPGYGRVTHSEPGPEKRHAELRLPTVTPKALYLSFWGVGHQGLREAALQLIDRTELNALVIDAKGDQGGIPYRSAVALATQAGAQEVITVRDMPGLLKRLKDRGIYTIARVVAFKDDPLARARPEWAVRTRSGGLWTDQEGLAWTDPFRREVWDYVLDVAEETARLGFDEIQFDYVRFPDQIGLTYSQPSTEAGRVAAISGFLAEARRRLAPYNVFLVADVFGYVLWNLDDTEIGQRLEDLVPHLDYVSPMLYPSGFQHGIPRYRDPVAHPYEIVDLSLRRGRQRTGLPAVRFRPWLQAFQDYAFDCRPFGAHEIGAQIRAAEAFGANGWMLWNPRNRYSADGLREK
jgi:hypothetical protein